MDFGLRTWKVELPFPETEKTVEDAVWGCKGKKIRSSVLDIVNLKHF